MIHQPNFFRAASLVLALSATAAPPAGASKTHGSQGTPGHQAGQTTPSESAAGEIRKVDMDAKKLTIRHGEIKHLDMPPMTMVFQVKDAGVLDKFKVGDKVRFTVQKSDTGFVITDIQPAK